jgi:ribosomal protein L24
MSKQFIYIDDSGDAGLRNSNTDQLIVAAVIVVDEKMKKLMAEAINLFRRRLGWVELHEFKFHKIEKRILIDLIDFVKGFDFKAYAVVLDKRDIDPSNVQKSKISLYNYTLKELLLRVCKNDQVVVIDGEAAKKHAGKVRAYLRQNLKANGIEKVSIRFVDSRKDSLVQLADIIAGAIARSYKDKTDAQKYLKMLKDKIVKIDEITL